MLAFRVRLLRGPHLLLCTLDLVGHWWRRECDSSPQQFYLLGRIPDAKTGSYGRELQTSSTLVAASSVQLVADCTSHIPTRGTSPAVLVSQRRRPDGNTRGEYHTHFLPLLPLNRLEVTVVILHLHPRAYTREGTTTLQPRATNPINRLGSRICWDIAENTSGGRSRTPVKVSTVRQGRSDSDPCGDVRWLSTDRDAFIMQLPPFPNIWCGGNGRHTSISQKSDE